MELWIILFTLLSNHEIMNCKLCNRESREKEAFWSLSWKKVDTVEYKARKTDGRTCYIDEVCVDCVTHYEGRPPLGLGAINEIREIGITKNEYYKEKGY